MPLVVLGNVSPLDSVKPDPQTTDVETFPLDVPNGREDNNTETVVNVPAGRKVSVAVAEISGVWYRDHSSDPPEWVWSEDAGLAAALASEYTWGEGERESSPGSEEYLPPHECQVGVPSDWQGYHDWVQQLPPVAAPAEEEAEPRERRHDE